MRPFNDLSELGQRGRLRKLAVAALAPYRLPGASLRFVNHGENTTFRVDSVAQAAESQLFVPGRYLLRVHGADYNTHEQIEAELTWLHSLRADLGLAVPEPVALDAGFVQTVAVEGVPTPRPCSLLRWMRGGLRGKQPSDADIAKVGRLVALLHEHASGWPPALRRPWQAGAAGFQRRRWDLTGMVGVNPDGTDDGRYGWDGVPPEHRDLFQTIGGLLGNAMDELGEGPAVFGLIHADLHFGNVLFADGEARAIDFDDCGYGHWIYDLAAVLSRWTLTERWDAALAAFLKGYHSVRPFPADQLPYLDDFIAGRRLGLILWMLGKAVHDPSFRRDVDRDTPAFAAYFQAYLARHSGATGALPS